MTSGTTAAPVALGNRLPVGVALRRAFAAGYGLDALRADLMAGMVVGIVALPLSMALAIAVGVPPQHGLYTAMIAGAVTALAGGSKFQVTGPTAAFVVILAPIASHHGLPGLLTAGCMAGVVLVAMGLAGFGRFIEFVPYPVTTGFTSGIATVIAMLQLKDVFGLRLAALPDEFVARVLAMWSARGSASAAEALVAAATIALLVIVPRLTRRIPAPLVAIAGVAAGVAAIGWLVPSFTVATIGSRFHATVAGHDVAGIPPVLPRPAVPWGPGGLQVHTLRALVPAALTIAMLGALESLLSAVVADGMTGKRHDPNAELVGQGLGNLVAPFFGGIAATGALARTATSIRAGARSPVAALVHAAVVLVSMVVLAPLVAYVPMASLAGLLLVVAWNMSEARHFAHMLRVGPRNDVAVLLTCFVLTVLMDMVVAVTVGIVLAALLFMGRMAELTTARLVTDGDEEASYEIPPGVALYEITGALFFGAAQRAIASLRTVAGDVRIVVLGLGRVPVIDASGLVALENALGDLAHKFVILAGAPPEVRRMFEKAELEQRLEHVLFADSVEQGLDIARDLVVLNPGWRTAARAAS